MRAGIDGLLACGHRQVSSAIRRRHPSQRAASGPSSGVGPRASIRLSDVLNAQLHRARLSDAELAARCDGCRRRIALDTCR